MDSASEHAGMRAIASTHAREEMASAAFCPSFEPDREVTPEVVQVGRLSGLEGRHPGAPAEVGETES